MTQGKCTARRNTEGGGLSGLSQCRKLDPTLNRHCNYAKCPKNRKVLATLMRPFNASQCPEFSTDSVGLFFHPAGMPTVCNTRKSCPECYEKHGPAKMKSWAHSPPCVLGPGVWEALFPVYLDHRGPGALLGPEQLRNRESSSPP